jgi:hypothetical protein
LKSFSPPLNIFGLYIITEKNHDETGEKHKKREKMEKRGREIWGSDPPNVFLGCVV